MTHIKTDTDGKVNSVCVHLYMHAFLCLLCKSTFFARQWLPINEFRADLYAAPFQKTLNNKQIIIYEPQISPAEFGWGAVHICE